ncbi:MAG: hypothetical protein ACFCU1_00130 [Sumerlaeia bacterium]
MEFTLKQLIDQTRQRLMSDQEILLAERRARRIELGSSSLEKWDKVESSLISTSVKKAAEECGEISAEDVEFLEQVLVISLRQVAFAAGADDATRLAKNLDFVFKAIWKQGISARLVSLSFEHLRDQLKSAFPVAEFNQVDRMTRFAHLALVSLASYSENHEMVTQRSLHDLFTSYPKWETQDPSLRRRLGAFAESLMTSSSRSLLPDGADQLTDLLYRTAEKTKKDKVFGQAVVELIPLLNENMSGPDLNRYHLKTKTVWFQVMTYLKISASLNQTRDAICQSIWKKLSEANKNAFPDLKEAEKNIKADSIELLKACCLTLAPGGIHLYHTEMKTLDQRLYRYKFDEQVVHQWHTLLHEEALRIMGAELFGEISATLEQSIQFLSVSADFATKRPEILVEVAGKLAEEFPAIFEKKERYLAYVIRDHEALLDSVYLTLLPHSEMLTLGRIAIFGDVLIADKFPKKLMNRSFELLEEAVASKFTDRISGLINPRLSACMRYFRVTVELATAEDKLLKDASDQIIEKYKSQIIGFGNGEEKVRRDARTFFRSALASIIPGNEFDLNWGHDVLYEVLQDRQFNAEMMNEHIASLIASVKANLDADTCQWLVPILQRSQKFTIAACALAPKEEKIIDQTVKTILEKHPQIKLSHSSAHRHLSRDFTRLFRFSLLSLFGKGQMQMAENLTIFRDVIASEQLSVSYIRDCYQGIKNALKLQLSEEASAIWLSVLEPSTQAIIATTEVIDREETLLAIVDKQCEGQEPADALLLQQVADLCLRVGPLTCFAGGEALFAHHLRVKAIQATASSTMTAATIWNMLSELHKGAENFLEGNTATIMVRAIDCARNYLALQVSVSSVESEVLRDAVKKAVTAAGLNGNSEMLFHQDGRQLLQASLLALLPGTNAVSEQIYQTLSTIYQHHRTGNQGVITSTLEHLKQSFQQHLKHGPVNELNNQMDTFVKRLAA